MKEVGLKDYDVVILYAISRYKDVKDTNPNGTQLIGYVYYLLKTQQLPFYKKSKGLSKTTIYESIKKLKDLDLIYITKGKKGREIILDISEKGRQLLTEIPVADLRQTINERYEYFSKTLKTTISNELIEHASFNLLILFFQSLYFGFEEIAEAIAEDLQKSVPGSAYTVLSYSTLAKIKNEERYWKKAIEEKLKYAEKLVSQFIYEYASILYFNVGRIEIEKIKDEIRGIEHTNKAIDLFLKHIQLENNIIQYCWKEEEINLVKFILSQKSDERKQLVNKIFSSLEKIINEKEFEGVLYSLPGLETIVPLLTKEEESKIKEKLLRKFSKIRRKSVKNFDALARMFMFLGLYNKARRYFLKAARDSESITNSNTVEEESKLVDLIYAFKEYKELGRSNDSKRVAKRISKIIHNKARAFLYYKRFESFCEWLSDFCQEACKTADMWDEHKLLCMTGIDEIYKNALDEFNKGNYLNAISLLVACGKLSRSIEENLTEKKCVDLIQKSLNALKFSNPSVYLNISLNCSLNEYLEDFFRRIGNKDKASEYSKKFVISQFLERILKYTERFEDLLRWMVFKEL